MEMFYKITILVAIIFLILILTVIGILMGKKSNVVTYPPVASQCPDYWTYDGSNCVVPNTGCPANDGSVKDCKPNMLNGISVANLTPTSVSGLTRVSNPDKTTTYSIDFNNPGWKGTCGQMQWAKKNNIEWDGVSNFNSC